MAEYYKYEVGLGHAPSYQVSGHPFLTGSSTIAAGEQHKVLFPKVAKSVTVQNTGGSNILVHFTDKDEGETMNGRHYITLPALADGRSLSRMTFDVKCSEVYVTAQGTTSYEVYAELTGINTDMMYNLTGSGLTD
tara:strand:+ start:2372 stop:2776 length:405 start_codon:yes stop_codon:yes gene_type:complete